MRYSIFVWEHDGGGAWALLMQVDVKQEAEEEEEVQSPRARQMPRRGRQAMVVIDD